MKKLITLSVLILALGLLFTSCSQEKQTEVSFDSVKGSSTILGQALYNEGAKKTQDGTIAHSNLVPASKQTIMVTVPFSDYNAGSTGVGEKTFTTVTDSIGNYSIEIPTPVTGINATINIKPFKANYHVTLNNDVKTVDSALYNTIASNVVTLKDGQVKKVNLEITTQDKPDNLQRTTPITVKGLIQAPCEKTSNGLITTGGLKNLSCEVTLLLNNSTDENRVIQYTTLSAADGSYSFDAKFYNNWEYSDVTATIGVNEFYAPENSANAFTHNYQTVTGGALDILNQEIGGLYKTNTPASTKLKPIYALGELYPILDLKMEFTPLNIRNNIKGIGNDAVDKDENGKQIYDYNDPMNWGLGESWN